MRKIKKVEYDDYECSSNGEEKCPYCGYDNFVEVEDYWGQEEDRITQCGNCEKFYVSTIFYDVSFTTEPYENKFLYERDRISKNIIKYKNSLNKAIDEKDESLIDYYASIIKYEYKNLEKLAKEAENILGEDVFRE